MATDEKTYMSYVIVSPGSDLECQEQTIDSLIANLPPEGVVVKVHSAGVCHTDLHQWQDGGYRLSETQMFSFVGRPGYGYPKVPGHEIAGTVYSLGKGLTGDKVPFKIGDRVCVYPWIGCMQCFHCHNEHDDYCIGGVSHEIGMNINGGYSEFVSLPHHRYVVPFSPSISMDLASLLGCSCLTAYNAIKTGVSVITEPLLKESNELQVVVIGLGGLGQWALSFLPILLAPKIKGKLTITGIDVNKAKLDAAIKDGLVHKILQISPSESTEKQAKDWLAKTCSQYHIVIDFVNNPVTFDLSVHILGKGGVLILVGLFGGTGSLQLPLFALSRKRIVGIQTGSLKDFKEVLEFLESNIDVIKGPELMPYKLCDCMKALNDLKDGKVHGRAILKN